MSAGARASLTRLHFLEPSVSSGVRTFIREAAAEVWDELARPGMGRPDNCLSSVGVWTRRLREAGIPFEQLGSQTVVGRGQLGGYRLISGEIVDHHLLAVGDELASLIRRPDQSTSVTLATCHSIVTSLPTALRFRPGGNTSSR